MKKHRSAIDISALTRESARDSTYTKEINAKKKSLDNLSITVKRFVTSKRKDYFILTLGTLLYKIYYLTHINEGNGNIRQEYNNFTSYDYLNKWIDIFNNFSTEEKQDLFYRYQDFYLHPKSYSYKKSFGKPLNIVFDSSKEEIYSQSIKYCQQNFDHKFIEFQFISLGFFYLIEKALKDNYLLEFCKEIYQPDLFLDTKFGLTLQSRFVGKEYQPQELSNEEINELCFILDRLINLSTTNIKATIQDTIKNSLELDTVNLNNNFIDLQTAIDKVKPIIIKDGYLNNVFSVLTNLSKENNKQEIEQESFLKDRLVEFLRTEFNEDDSEDILKFISKKFIPKKNSKSNKHVITIHFFRDKSAHECYLGLLLFFSLHLEKIKIATKSNFKDNNFQLYNQALVKSTVYNQYLLKAISVIDKTLNKQ